MPLQPKWPNSPVLGGMNGVRLSRRTYAMPAATKITSTTLLITTRIVFVLADSRMPMTMSIAPLRIVGAEQYAVRPDEQLVVLFPRLDQPASSVVDVYDIVPSR
jgi:hypothetical protein